MEGKGWFVIYGLLLFFMIYLFLAQRQLAGEVRQLQASMFKEAEVSPEASPLAELEPVPSSSPSPDLSSPASRDKKRKDDLHILKTALFSYHDEKKSYPGELKELQGDDLAVIPADPLSPKYRYRYTKTNKGFLLTAYLESKNDPDDKKSDGKADQIYSLSEASR